MQSSGPLVEIPRMPLARTTGGIYLAFVVCLFLADTLGHIVVGDVELAYEVLATDPSQLELAVTLAVLSALLFAGAAWACTSCSGRWFFQGMLLPDQTALSTPGLALRFIAEVALGVWLLVKGINESPGIPSMPSATA